MIVLPNWTYSAALATVLSMTVMSGLVHGYLDARWTTERDVQESAANLLQLPEKVGPWVLASDLELPSAAQRVLRCYGYLNREYWNPDTGQRVVVAVLFGPRGPIAVHTPEICYSSAGTQPIGNRVAETIETDGQSDQLWRIQLGRGDDPSPVLDVWYAWSEGGPWYAGEYPRLWMTDRLYKIQLAGAPSVNGSAPPCRDFLTHFLPIVRKAIDTP